WGSRFVLFRDRWASAGACAAVIKSESLLPIGNKDQELSWPESARVDRYKPRPQMVLKPWPDATAPYPCTWCNHEDPEQNACECPNHPGHRYMGAFCQCVEPYCVRICLYDPPL